MDEYQAYDNSLSICDDTKENRTPEWLQKRRADRPAITGQFSRGVGETDDRAFMRDIAFNRHSMNDGHHVSPSDNGIIQVGTDGIRVALVQPIDVDMLRKTLTAAVRATVGLDLSQPLPGDWEMCQPMFNKYIELRSQSDMMNTDELDGVCESGHESHRVRTTAEQLFVEGMVPMQDWEEMLKGGLQTALETQTIVFAVSGVSRTNTHQLVRSRRAAFHQQSQRAGYMGDMPEVRCPEVIFQNPKARMVFFQSVMRSWRAYREICDMDISYQDARFVLPEGTTNFILLEYPIREFLNVYAYRGCSMFQWEMVHVMRACREALIKEHPFMEPYVKISCEKIQRCTFQGWEDVEEQCDFPWAKHELRTFQPAHHRITKKGE